MIYLDFKILYHFEWIITTRNRKTEGENRKEKRERAREKGTNINDCNNNKKTSPKTCKRNTAFCWLICLCVCGCEVDVFEGKVGMLTVTKKEEEQEEQEGVGGKENDRRNTRLTK